MSLINRICLIIFLLCSGISSATDFNCPAPSSEANPTHTNPFLVYSEAEARLKISNPNWYRNRPEITGQPDVVIAIDEADPGGNIKFSPAENARIVDSKSCTLAKNQLLKTFISNRGLMGFPQEFENKEGLAKFISWYYFSGITDEQKSKAISVIKAEENYAVQCLTSKIPKELNGNSIKSVVGLLFLDQQPFCSAFRISANSLITAKHCFLNDVSGNLLSTTKNVLEGKVKIWFRYENEPNDRFQVCNESLPQETSSFFPDKDNTKIMIAGTHTNVPKWEWRKTPIPLGTSLYIRSYFPFPESNDPLTNMQSTAKGGCTVLVNKNNCVIHACQTTPIMSGSPVFIRPEPTKNSDKLEVVGIHLGTARYASRSNGSNFCGSLDGAKYPESNFAYQPGGYTP